MYCFVIILKSYGSTNYIYKTNLHVNPQLKAYICFCTVNTRVLLWAKFCSSIMFVIPYVFLLYTCNCKCLNSSNYSVVEAQ
jgi:TRAP-type mannitol/chloroaromatic compound transport system permease small subunit